MSLFNSSEMQRRRVSESAQAGRKNLQTQTLMGDGAGMEVKLLGGLIQRCGHRLRGCFGSPKTVLTCEVRREHKEKRLHHGGHSPTENPWLELGCPKHFLSPSVASGRCGCT